MSGGDAVAADDGSCSRVLEVREVDEHVEDEAALFLVEAKKARRLKHIELQTWHFLELRKDPPRHGMNIHFEQLLLPSYQSKR
jgi:hypothetical protein